MALKGLELLYFGYRDFIAWPDEKLEKYGLGRAHHRILHFVWRHPGLTVAELLKVLNITKQSLSRVLGKLIDDKYIYQQVGEKDRRQRLLFLTEQGDELLEELKVHELDHMRAAYAKSGDEAVKGFWTVLENLLNEENHDEVMALVTKEEK